MNLQHTEGLFRQLMEEGLGLDLTDPNLQDTPKRFSKMMIDELIVNQHNRELPDSLIKTFPNDYNYDEIIMLDNIPFVSLCSHHLLPFPGLAWFAYIPDKKLMGASKPSRVIEHFSRSLQLQENLSAEVIDSIMKKVEPKGAMLVMRAVHGCMSCRGAKTGLNAGMLTSITRGCFRDNLDTRLEALHLIEMSMRINQ